MRPLCLRLRRVARSRSVYPDIHSISTVSPKLLAQPSIVSGSPAQGSGVNQTFTVNVSSTSTLKYVYLLVTSSTVWTPVLSCMPMYWLQGSQFILANDTNTGWIGAANGQAANSKCTLNTNASTVSSAGGLTTVNFSITFNSTFPGDKNSERARH